MCSPLFTLMRKDKLGFVRSTGPDSIATARLADPCDESEDESNTSCMSTGTVSIAGGDLLCGKLRLLTEELKGKFGRKKSRISIKSTSNESSSLTMQQPLQQETSGTSNDCNNNRSRSNSIAMAALDAANMQDSSTESGRNSSSAPESRSPFVHRALPPLPPVDDDNDVANQLQSDSGHRLLKSNTSTSGLGARTERFNFDSSGDESVNEAPAEFRRLNRHQLSADLPRTSLIAGPTTRFGCTIPPPHLQKPVPPCDASDMDDEDDSDSVEGVHNLSEQVQVTTATNLINLSTNLIQDLATESEPGPICPAIPSDNDEEMRKMLDYAASIEKVKDCGWYWGPISGDKAEKLLANEPDGSFIVRDSSDEHYIFSLTFKLNGSVRHVRIEHDQGNFSFGSLQKFSCSTIVDFIKEAVEHSRSGRFFFFLHRLPIMGPMRVQLLHPVSRFKRIQSLQHLCRFVILRHVRRDLIFDLPLPERLKNYLNTANYYLENVQP